jgi:hypothetical protein
VAKGNHGHAGIGQMRFKLPFDSMEATVRIGQLKRIASRHGGIVIEQEQVVGREWGLLFRMGRGGGLSEFRIHRLLSGAAGGYAGSLVLPGPDPELAPHRAAVESSARRIASALHRAGYFGPVGIDLYIHETREGPRLRSLVDLNARQSMAWPAHGLAARFPGRAILMRQLPASELCVPLGYEGLRERCDKLSFDRPGGRGAVWLTPLLPLSRHTLAFIGDSEAEVLKIQDDVLGRDKAMQNEK